MLNARLASPRLAALGAAVASLSLAAAPALAATPYVTTVGSSTSGTFPVTATSTVSSVFTLGSQTFTCTGSSVTGNVYAGSNASIIGQVTGIGWTGCTWSGAIGITVSGTSSVAWNLIATGGDTTGSSDTVTGTVTQSSTAMNARVVWNSGCAFDLQATTVGATRFSESDQKLQVLGTGGDLLVKNVNSAFLCLGLVSNNQAASFAGTYLLSTGDAGNVLIS